jgi:glycosyltransferase involved in cell wall biosynthesis
MKRSISALIPTFNRGDLIGETLDSILSQSYGCAEVIVVDDGSTDNTREVVSHFGSRVRYHLTENGGSPRARNIAASLATSEFYAFCDSDDLWRHDKLEQQIALHDSRPDMQYSFTNFSLVVEGEWRTQTEFEQAPDPSLHPYCLSGTGPVVLETPFYDQIVRFQPTRPSSEMVSAQLFKKLGGFRHELGRTRYEDAEFALRCMQHPPIGVVREPVVGIRIHSSNISKDMYEVHKGKIKILEYAMEHHEISDGTRELMLDEVEQTRIEAAYHAFRKEEFDQLRSLLEPVRRSAMDFKTWMKLWIARQPMPVAKTARRLLIKSA